jgi:uncharacterized protein (DUF302 family)
MFDRDLPYGFGATVALPFDEALEHTKEALIAEGFGVLAEIDIAATLRRRLGVELAPYVILGACNPPLAHRALAAEPDVGLLLPCNVVVYAAGEPGRCVVAALDPAAALSLTPNPALGAIADEVAARLRRALVRMMARAAPAAAPPAVEVAEEVC